MSLFNQVREISEKQNLRLVIFDWNGVLDAQEAVKFSLVKEWIPNANSAAVKKILVAIERNFEQKKSLPFVENLVQSFGEEGISISIQRAQEFVRRVYEESSDGAFAFKALEQLQDHVSVWRVQ